MRFIAGTALGNVGLLPALSYRPAPTIAPPLPKRVNQTHLLHAIFVSVSYTVSVSH